MKKFISIFVSLLALSVFISCNMNVTLPGKKKGPDNVVSESEHGFTIKLPERVARDVYYGPEDAALYELTLIQNGKVLVNKTGEPGETVLLPVKEDGYYTINIVAYNSDNVVIGEGSTTSIIRLTDGLVTIDIKIIAGKKEIQIGVNIDWEIPDANFESYTFYFDESAMSATIRRYEYGGYSYLTLKSGDTVLNGDRIEFYRWINDGQKNKKIDKWYINGIEYSSKESFVIESMNADYSEYQLVEISYTERDLCNIKVKYDRESISAKYEAYDINEDSWIHLYPRSIPEDKTIDAWIINGVEYKIDERIGYENVYVYEDSLELILTYDNSIDGCYDISYTTRDLASYIILLEDGVECYNDNTLEKYHSGDYVTENSFITLVYPVEKNKIVEWYVNGYSLGYARADCITFRATQMYENNSTLEITTKIRDARQYTINFEEGITCTDSDNNVIENGSIVYEKQDIYLSLVVEDGIDYWWIINGESYGNNPRIIIEHHLSDKSGSIHISYEIYDSRFVIYFPDFIKCYMEKTNEELLSGDKVFEYETLRFESSEPVVWYNNGLLPEQSKYFDFDDYTLIVYVDHHFSENQCFCIDAERIELPGKCFGIKLDANTKCTGYDATTLTAYNGMVLTYTAIPDSGMIVDRWFVNGISQDGPEGINVFELIVNENEIEGDIIYVTFTQKPVY